MVKSREDDPYGSDIYMPEHMTANCLVNGTDICAGTAPDTP
ncbi:MAG: hypothetical protein PVI26_09265 [Chitinispirillia bacterium]